MLLQLWQRGLSTLNDPIVTQGAMALIFILSIVICIIMQSGKTHTMRRRLRHLQKLGLSTSNMADQYNPKFAAPEGTALDGPAQIKAIYLHPIKSCGSVEVNRALLTKSGFMYDRCFALASEVVTKDSDDASPQWRFISQRTKPTMSKIETELWLPHKDSNPNDSLVQAGGCVVVTFPNPDTPSWVDRLEAIFAARDLSAIPQVSFIAPLHVTAAQRDQCQIEMKAFGIHGREAKGLDMGRIPSIAASLPKLKKFLKIPRDQSFTLLRCTPDTLVRTDRNLAPLKYIGSPAVHGYTDQQPVNINSLSSIHAVSALLPSENQPLDALRFRANIWITNVPAYDEEMWKRYRILPSSDNTELRASVAPKLSVVCRTSRCTMPNVNLETGKFDADTPPPEKKKGRPQPSTTLVQYRTVETGNNSALGYIGMHCVPEDQSLKEAEEQEAGLYVAVGDEIEVLERGVHLYGSTGNDY